MYNSVHCKTGFELQRNMHALMLSVYQSPIFAFLIAGSSFSDYSWEWLRKKAEQKSQRAQLTPKETVIRNELGSFLTEPLILPPTSAGNAASSDRTVIESCSSLQWWSHHRSRYPSLVPVVRMLFGVPATSVPSERLFSKAGLVISDRRSRLSPLHAEQQCFMSCNWLD